MGYSQIPKNTNACQTQIEGDKNLVMIPRTSNFRSRSSLRTKAYQLLSKRTELSTQESEVFSHCNSSHPLMPPRKKRGMGFSQTELDSLLDVIEEILPIGMGEWDDVERQHHSMYPDRDRNRDALRRKFAKLYLKKIPTGDPKCPPEVRRAKRIYELIKNKTDSSDGEGGGAAGHDYDNIAVEEGDVHHQADDDGDEGAEEDEDGSDFYEDAAEEQFVSADEDQSGPRTIVAAGVGGDTEERSSSTTQLLRRSGEETASTATRKRALSSQISRVGSKRRVKSSLNDDEDFSFKDMFKMAMMQRQLESEERHREEHRRREYEDMRRRDEERIRRDEERLRRDEMRQNQQMFQQMFAMAFAMQHSQPLSQHPINSILGVQHDGNENRTQALTTSPPNYDGGGDENREVTNANDDGNLDFN